MKTIHKYQLVTDFSGFTNFSAPMDAKFLCVQMQGFYPFIWAEVDPENPVTQIYTIERVGTGWAVPTHSQYLGTVQDGSFVWHYYLNGVR